jgi:hypothetical protein
MNLVFLFLVPIISEAHVLLGEIGDDGLIRPSNTTCTGVLNEDYCNDFSGCTWMHDVSPSCRMSGYLPPSGHCKSQKKNITCITWTACEWIDCYDDGRCVERPTPDPTTSPTFNPTSSPTNSTQSPTKTPTGKTPKPTRRPTNKPSNTPTLKPTTLEPTSSPFGRQDNKPNHNTGGKILASFSIILTLAIVGFQNRIVDE